MFNKIADKLNDSTLKSQARKYASITGRALSSSEKTEMINFLNNPKVTAISREVQDEMSKNQVISTMKVPMSMYKDGTFMDMRSVLIPTDIGNTGPAHINTWRPNYRKASSKSTELEHVRDSLKSTASWWGRQTGSKYYNGWMNRIDSAYNEAKSWKPIFGGGVGGEEPNIVANRQGLPGYRTFNKHNLTGLNLAKTLKSGSDGRVYEYLTKIINALQSIVTNTSNTNTKLEDIKAIKSENQNNTNNVAVIDKSKKETNSPMFDIAANRRANKIDQAYQTAKLIASGAQ